MQPLSNNWSSILTVTVLHVSLSLSQSTFGTSPATLGRCLVRWSARLDSLVVMVARKAFGMHQTCCGYWPQWVQTPSHSGPHIFTAFHSCVSDYDIFCNHPPEKSSTLGKFLGFCLVSLALLDRNMAPLAKLQESLTHDHILSAFLGIYMAPTLLCSSICCLSAFLSSQYICLNISHVHSLSQCSGGAFAMWVDRPGQSIWLPSRVKHCGVENIVQCQFFLGSGHSRTPSTLSYTRATKLHAEASKRIQVLPFAKENRFIWQRARRSCLSLKVTARLWSAWPCQIWTCLAHEPCE